MILNYIAHIPSHFIILPPPCLTVRARAYYTSNRLIISTNNLPGPLTPQIITKGTETWIIRKFKYLFCFCRFSCFWLLCSMLCVCEHCFYFEPLLSLLLPTLSGMIHIHLEIKYIWLQSLTMRFFLHYWSGITRISSLSTGHLQGVENISYLSFGRIAAESFRYFYK